MYIEYKHRQAYSREVRTEHRSAYYLSPLPINRRGTSGSQPSREPNHPYRRRRRQLTAPPAPPNDIPGGINASRRGGHPAQQRRSHGLRGAGPAPREQSSTSRHGPRRTRLRSSARHPAAVHHSAPAQKLGPHRRAIRWRALSDTRCCCASRGDRGDLTRPGLGAGPSAVEGRLRHLSFVARELI